MTGGAAGIGAVLTTSAVAASMENEDGSFYSTYGWYPRSVDAAIATVAYMKRHRAALFRGVAATSDYLGARLRSLDYDVQPDIRVRGLAVAIDFDDEAYAEEIQARCRRRGLLTSTEGGALLLLPALTVTRPIAAAAMDILERCL
jgi:putrescine aminotransferase/taurine--2-oxoglutarate transaminase